LHGVDFDVESGEVLGVTGMAGSGFADIPYALFGALRATAGTLELGEEHLDLPALTESAAIASRIALVPEDPPRLAIVREASIRENMSLLALPQFVKGGALRPRSEASYVSKLVTTFNILLADLSSPIEELSGGNQQKCVLAKWLSGEPRLLLLHEPTQGVDVGGRFEIWQHLRRAAREGAAAIVASESAEELAELCDRVLVFRDGQIAAELIGSDVEKHRIVELSLAAPDVPA
jgi:ribose transport system ATP-binding protein